MQHVLREIARLEAQLAHISDQLADLRKQVSGTSGPRQRRTQGFTRPPPPMLEPAEAGMPSSVPESNLGPPPPAPSSIPAPSPSKPEGTRPSARHASSAPPESAPPNSDVVSRDPRITPSRRSAVQAGRYEFVGEGRSQRRK